MDVAGSLAQLISEMAGCRPRLAVAVDGPPTAGKTTLADLIADRLSLPVVRVGVEAFLLPRQVRYRRGELSGEGNYRDCFDYEAITSRCLGPFRGSEPVICTAAYDLRSDQHRDAETVIPTAAVLVFDGVFLLRPELAGQWDLAIYLRVSPGTILRRAVARDLDRLGSPQEIRRRYLGRYLPGQALYRAEAVPEDTAHVVIGNDNASNPVIIRWHPPGSAAHEGPGRDEKNGSHRPPDQ